MSSHAQGTSPASGSTKDMKEEEAWLVVFLARIFAPFVPSW
jgi:hypothetical protein